MNTALTRRESLWADEPVMRDGRVLDTGIKALSLCARAQDDILCAVTSSHPRNWLRDAEMHATELLGHIRAMQAVLTSEAVS